MPYRDLPILPIERPIASRPSYRYPPDHGNRRQRTT
jgi:hypothetical protein